MITITHLTYQIKNKTLFKNSCITFEPNKINLITGENGTGKSSLLHIIKGDMPQNSMTTGFLTYKDMEYNLNAAARPQTGYVVQQYRQMLIPSMTVEKNIAAARMNKNPALKRLAQTDDLATKLNQFNINTNQNIQDLSGGQQQIVAIFLMLAHNIDILLLDEPTAALDIENRKLVMSFLYSLAEKGSCYIIMVTHDQNILNTESPLQRVLSMESLK